MENKKRFIFNIDGTLLVPDFSFRQEYFRSVLSEEDADRFLPKITGILNEYEKTHFRYDIKDLSRFMSTKSGIFVSPEVIKAWNLTFQDTDIVLIDGAAETLDYLNSKNASLAVFTNWFLDSQKKRLKESGLITYFDEIYGGEVCLKPFKDSFRLACGDYLENECVMIGDSYEMDVLGATNAGIDAIYYNPKNKEYELPEKVKLNVLEV